MKKNLFSLLLALLVISSIMLIKACSSASSHQVYDPADTILTESQKRLASNALKGLAISPGLQIQTMATEPTLINPTNIDVDEKGRVWVTEAYNYRFQINNNKPRTEGDRILILEDKDGDGRLETSKVFYQGSELNAPLGISVLGNRVIISQSPYVWIFYDDNGDDKADRKEILFQGIGGEQHDHGMHSFTFGPDGKLYFNFGNYGQTLKDKNNKVVLDQDGDEIGPGKYREGMVFRSDPDGSNVECLGHNFRNNFELAVDSYGSIWQSDNDDDGNRGVRINYVMDYGNYGYKDEMTGASWQAKRTNLEDSIPLRHWHLNDPGVVPNLLQTGAGSPTGILLYEGSLLPAQYQNQIIHSDPGPNVVRSYPVKKNGAGYTAGILNILKGENDQWFRPSDVCIAPDGSLIVADWYDPGVGGHRVGDLQRGRIYRIAPDVSQYNIPLYDYSTPDGAINALQNPNLAVRRHAWLALQEMGKKAVPGLEKLWRKASNPRMRVRAFWVLVKMPSGQNYINEAIKDPNPDIRITGLRAARQLKLEMIPLVRKLANDKDPQVRRESIIALRHNKSPEAAELWARLASQHDGNDRWYLEALGIAADRQWDSFFEAYLQLNKTPLLNPAGRDLIWRARTEQSLPLLAKLASDSKYDLKSRLRYFRAFDFHTGPEKSKILVKMIEDNPTGNIEFKSLVLNHLDTQFALQSPLARQTLMEVLQAVSGKVDYLDLVRRYELQSETENLLKLAIAKSNEPIGVDAARLLLELKGTTVLNKVLNGSDSNQINSILTALGGVGNTESVGILEKISLLNNQNTDVSENAAEMLGKSRTGEDRVLDLLRTKKAPSDLIPYFVAGLKGSRRKAVYEESLTFLPETVKKNNPKPSITLNELLALTSNSKNGAAVFKRSCNVCHQVDREGYDVGPKLTEIGSKLPKEGLFDAIINPSAGISFGYETWQVEMKDGSSLIGIISSRTPTEIELKFPGGLNQKILTNNIKTIRMIPESMMPEGLHEAMTAQELADIIQYMATLKKKG
ncbi:MAG: c-type cytochrome [Daejeonella sp.]|uniref:PVC-type heme-binding CxxCH protein n=1 Tax=Daejeonella sp. TaxID=2805397 RepID=UPI002734CBDB|nr:PVC-type heme-binding CxxCH protein [Daejeonella sp.]MDP3467924.1 c-type cytochrome [Daejeonella sp.]